MSSSATGCSCLLLSRAESVDIGNNQRSGSLVRKYFPENSFRGFVRHDVNATDSTMDGVLDGLCLRQHAFHDPPFFAQALEPAEVGVRNQGRWILDALQNAGG